MYYILLQASKIFVYLRCRAQTLNALFKKQRNEGHGRYRLSAGSSYARYNVNRCPGAGRLLQMHSSMDDDDPEFQAFLKQVNDSLFLFTASCLYYSRFRMCPPTCPRAWSRNPAHPFQAPKKVPEHTGGWIMTRRRDTNRGQLLLLQSQVFHSRSLPPSGWSSRYLQNSCIYIRFSSYFCSPRARPPTMAVRNMKSFKSYTKAQQLPQANMAEVHRSVAPNLRALNLWPCPREQWPLLLLMTRWGKKNERKRNNFTKVIISSMCLRFNLAQVLVIGLAATPPWAVKWAWAIASHLGFHSANH